MDFLCSVNLLFLCSLVLFLRESFRLSFKGGRGGFCILLQCVYVCVSVVFVLLSKGKDIRFAKTDGHEMSPHR